MAEKIDKKKSRKMKEWTLESNLDKVIDLVESKPAGVMGIIGAKLRKEIQSTTLQTQYKTRTKIMQKSLQYWARKREKDLQIGFKMSIEKNPSGVGRGIVGGIITGQEPDPIKSVVVKNKDYIQQIIAKALDEIRKEGS